METRKRSEKGMFFFLLGARMVKKGRKGMGKSVC
jgi:hypothetical protein